MKLQPYLKVAVERARNRQRFPGERKWLKDLGLILRKRDARRADGIMSAAAPSVFEPDIREIMLESIPNAIRRIDMVVEDDEGVLPSIVGIGDVRAPIHTIEIDKGLSTEGIRATRVDAC